MIRISSQLFSANQWSDTIISVMIRRTRNSRVKKKRHPVSVLRTINII